MRRTSGGTLDSYGDATFTEVTTTGHRGYFQVADRPGETVIIAGKEIAYDAVTYASASMLVGENDVLLFGSSTATAVATRYHVKGVRTVWDGNVLDHKEIFVAQEVK